MEPYRRLHPTCDRFTEREYRAIGDRAVARIKRAIANRKAEQQVGIDQRKHQREEDGDADAHD